MKMRSGTPGIMLLFQEIRALSCKIMFGHIDKVLVLRAFISPGSELASEIGNNQDKYNVRAYCLGKCLESDYVHERNK